ncbi:MAG TPA: hypothetical protein VE291_08395 [Terracidiphilus sp.]|jgi:hypothetical protein|nr:hypothetical protein [Terracidiphilus sp.]
MAAGTVPPPHPYIQQIEHLFYNYRLAYFNRRYYTVLLGRKRRFDLANQLFFTLSTAIAMVALSLIPPALTAWREQITIGASCIAGLSFLLSIALAIMGWSQSISDLHSRVNAWHRAERLVLSGIRFILHTAESMRDAELQVQFADSAYFAADDLPDADRENKKLELAILREIEISIPPDYVWRVL